MTHYISRFRDLNNHQGMAISVSYYVSLNIPNAFRGIVYIQKLMHNLKEWNGII